QALCHRATPDRPVELRQLPSYSLFSLYLNSQRPKTNSQPLPTPDSQQRPIGNWELGVVGRWKLAVGSSFAFRRANFSRLQRNCRDQLLEFRGVFRRVHALLEQPQRLDPPLEIAPLHLQRPQL